MLAARLRMLKSVRQQRARLASRPEPRKKAAKKRKKNEAKGNDHTVPTQQIQQTRRPTTATASSLLSVPPLNKQNKHFIHLFRFCCFIALTSLFYIHNSASNQTQQTASPIALAERRNTYNAIVY